MIEEGAGLTGVGRGRERAVRLVGTSFGFLAGVVGLAGVLWIADAFRSGVQAAAEGMIQTLGRLVGPVAISVVATYLLFSISRGLLRRSPWSRWAAVVLLATACLPPLVLFFQAVRGGIYTGAAVALLLLIPPAWASLLLTACGTDPLFDPKGAVFVIEAKEARAASASVLGLVFKVVLIAFGFLLTIALFALG